MSVTPVFILNCLALGKNSKGFTYSNITFMFIFYFILFIFYWGRVVYTLILLLLLLLLFLDREGRETVG